MMLLKFKCITALAFLILNQYILSSNAWLNLNIERGDQDIFDNPNCKNSTGVGCNSDGLNADCVNSTCKRCKCSSTYKTFLSSNDNNGRCVKDRRLLFIPNLSSFLVQSGDCIIPEYRSSAYYVVKTECNETDSRQRWIWTRYNQLMHADTIKCMETGIHLTASSGYGYYYIVVAECNSAQIKQLWQCLGKTFQLNASRYYMYQRFDLQSFVFASNENDFTERIKWRRFPSDKSLCSKAFGCYEFLNFIVSLAILVTDVRNCNQQCLKEKEISIPHKPGENLCFVLWDKLQYLDNGEWKQLVFRDDIFIIDKRDKRTFLKLNFTKATNVWTGLIVKLNFYCAEKKLTNVNSNCVVIKFKGTTYYSGTVPSTVNANGVSTVYTDTMSSTTNANYKSDSLPVVIVIVVCVVIAIFILCGIIGFMFYKRKRRIECKTRSDDADVRSRYVHADPLVTFRIPAMSHNFNYQIPYVENTELPNQAGASTLVEDKELVDDGGYLIILAELKKVSRDQTETSTTIPTRHDKDFEDKIGYAIPCVKNTVLPEQAGTSTVEPGYEEIRNYINNEEKEQVVDECGYVIPNANEMTLRHQPYLDERLPNDSDLVGDSIKNESDYEPLGERYEHVYQGLLPSTNR